MPANNVISTVVTPATNFNLTTLANVKADLSITANTDDAYLTRLIAAASSTVSQYCNRTFALQTYQDDFTPERDPRPFFLPNSYSPLTLANSPVVSVTSVVENGVTLVVGTDFVKDLRFGRLYRLDSQGRKCKWPALETVVIYVAGWNMPGDIGTDNPLLRRDALVEQAAIKMVSAAYSGRTRDPSLKGENILEGLYSYQMFAGGDMEDGLPVGVSAMLINYRFAAMA